MKIASFNCRGIGKKLKRKTIFKECLKFDFSCLQETFVSDLKSKEWKLDWIGDFYHVEGTSNSLGLIVLIRKKLEDGAVQIVIRKKRILCLKVTYNDFCFYIVNVYAPNSKKEKLLFFNDLYYVLDKINCENIFICGDFNMVYDNTRDIISGQPHDGEVVTKFKKWIDTFNLKDIWRLININGIDFTYSKNSPFVARRLDYIFTSEKLLHTVQNVEHIINSYSDHKIVVATISPNIFKRGISFWKMNTSILSDEIYLQQMNDHIDNFLVSIDQDQNPIETFELLKISVKSMTIQYCTQKNKSLKAKELALQNNLVALNKKITSGDKSYSTLSLYENTKKDLGILNVHRAKGALIRSRIKQIEEGEKCSNFFLNMEVNRGNNNTIFSLKGINDQNEIKILNEIKKYYEDIAKSNESIQNVDNKLENYLGDIEHNVLSGNEKDLCNLELSLDEVSKALTCINNDSSPGIDGIPVSWYKVFYNKIKLPLFNSLKCSVENECLGISTRRSVLTLLHKGKDLSKDELINWRPISITNTDYKIFSKCLATRMQNVLSTIIHQSQSGFVKGRSMVDHIRLIDDFINLSNTFNTPGMVVSLDFQKAFDSVEKSTILASLRKFNFGDYFLKLVKTLINNAESCVQNGGWLSGFFEVQRGIRQGCCASPILFIIVAEIMSIKIRANDNIHGLSFKKNNSNSKEFKLLSYADDVTLLLNNTDSLQNAIKDVQDFALFSGLNLNEKKSLGMWIGCDVDNTTTPGNISWIPKGNDLKILGIYFNSITEASENSKNWDSKIQEIEKCIRFLHRRGASLYGKVILCKTFLLSKISNILQALSLPKKVLDQIDSLLFKFIWQKKYSGSKAREKIKRSVLCRSVDEGGLGMIRSNDQQRVFLLKWVEKIALNKISLFNTSNITNIYFEQFGGLQYFLSSTKSYESSIKSKFWNDAISIWRLAKSKTCNESVATTDVLREPLFNNEKIMYKGRVLYFRKWIEKGIKFICDIVDNNRIISLEELKLRVGNHPSIIFEYNAVFNSLPKVWKEKIIYMNLPNNQYNSIENINEKVFCLLKKHNSIIRACLANDSGSEACGRSFWLRKLKTDIQEKYLCAFQATKESKLRLLHFKILHNIYPTSILLNRMGIKSSENCDFCGEKDFVEHMFVNCPKLNGFWDKISTLIYTYTQVKFNLSSSNILLGISKNNHISKKQLNIANHIILIAKFCISKMRYVEISNIFLLFEMELSLRKNQIPIQM